MSAVKSYFKRETRWTMVSLDHERTSDFHLSCWQSTRSAVPLLYCRGLLFLTSLVIVLYSMITYILNGTFAYWFIYLTHWGLTVICLATGFSAYISARCYFYGPISAEFRLPWYVKTYWVLYNIATPLAFLITIFYWTLLYEAGIEEEVNHALDVLVHGLNTLVVLLLLLASAQPSRLLHVYQPFIFAAVYVVFGLIYHFANGLDQKGNAYIYPVVDWSSPGTTVGVLVLTGVLLIAMHCVTIGLVLGRDSISSRFIKTSPAPPVAEEMPLRQPTNITSVP